MESYKHLFSKETVARWLATPGQQLIKPIDPGKDDRVFLEYPICLDSRNNLRGHRLCWEFLNPNHYVRRARPLRPGELLLDNEEPDEWSDSPPSYARCLELALLPIVIFDVVIVRNGYPNAALEIIHTSDLTPTKEHYLRRIQKEATIDVIGVSADWVLQQTGIPKRIEQMWYLRSGART